jgi:hypothetical protein
MELGVRENPLPDGERASSADWPTRRARRAMVRGSAIPE